MKPVTKSRNQREGRYAGWRVTGGRNSLNRNCQPINHERAGGRPHVNKAISLHGWKQLSKKRRAVPGGTAP